MARKGYTTKDPIRRVLELLGLANPPEPMIKTAAIPGRVGVVGERPIKSFHAAGDTGNTGPIGDGQVVTHEGGTGIVTTAYPLKVTYDLETIPDVAGNYTNADVSIDEQGRVVAASDGTPGGTMSSFAVDADGEDTILIEDSDTLSLRSSGDNVSVIVSAGLIEIAVDPVALTVWGDDDTLNIPLENEGNLTIMSSGDNVHVDVVENEISNYLTIAVDPVELTVEPDFGDPIALPGVATLPLYGNWGISTANIDGELQVYLNGYMRHVLVTSTGLTLDPATDGESIILMTGSGQTLILPLAGDFLYWEYRFHNASAGDLTIAPAYTDTIDGGSSLVIPAGGWATIIACAAEYWYRFN
jgi:hypothetical protein